MERHHTYGGQAVLEGVMIRGRRHMSVAVRRPDGGIALQCRPLNALFTGRLRQVPIVRGIIVLIETFTLGMRALAFSANVGMEEHGEELGKGAMATMIGTSLLFAIGLFFLVPVLASRSIEGVLGSDVASNAAEGAIRLAIFLGYLVLIGRLGEIRRVFMYHGAEHMTVHAREQGEPGEPLEVHSVRRYPTAHPRCGTAFLLVMMIVAIVVFVFIGRDPLWWLVSSRILLIPVIAAFSYEVVRFSGRHSSNPLVRLVMGPSLALQALTTRRPSDDQIEIAIAAMESAVQADDGELSVAETEPGRMPG